ncbi:MAG TPA: flagellar hook-basal body complex protein [Clostridiales bacterium]|nr:flagellar hook-basal body complex protein [Clostridiales bacterium]
MNRILQTGRSGLDSIQKKMDTIAHNIANAQTIGFKSQDVQFGDLIYDQVANRGIPLTSEAREKPIEIGTGSRVKNIRHKFEQGILVETSGRFDLAIEGGGFFGVQDENGEILLTRNGAFTLDGDGFLVDSSGKHVLMEIYSKDYQLERDNFTINEKGIMTVMDEAGQTVEIGRILLYDVPDLSMLTAVGENYFYTERQAYIVPLEGVRAEDSKIRQGYLESSSVNIAKELTDMLITQRAYSVNIKSIHAADEMWGMVNQLKR